MLFFWHLCIAIDQLCEFISGVQPSFDAADQNHTPHASITALYEEILEPAGGPVSSASRRTYEKMSAPPSGNDWTAIDRSRR